MCTVKLSQRSYSLQNALEWLSIHSSQDCSYRTQGHCSRGSSLPWVSIPELLADVDCAKTFLFKLRFLLAVLKAHLSWGGKWVGLAGGLLNVQWKMWQNHC